MINLEYANIPDIEDKKLDLPDASFLSYKPEFPKLKALWKEYGHFKNILVIGHGGSITNVMGIVESLGTEKEVKYLYTVDPDYIEKLKNKLNKADTLVIAVSRSGNNITQLEALLQFIDYPMICVAGKDTTLEQIGRKANAKLIAHPPIGGRYTALTEVALVPAIIAGVSVEKIYEGAQELYSQYKENNIARKAAEIFYALEQKGIVDVFMPFYSHELFAFENLIVQLCHESFGKDGQGQTYFAHEAPESQHHTNQRFFGGRKNIAGFFVKLDNFKHGLFTHVLASMHSIPIKDSTLFELNKMPLSFSMSAEFKGTWEDAKIHDIPIVSLSVSAISPKEIGAFIAFWQLFAVYSSVLRGVDPFNQPQVENSKQISWNKRKDFKRT